uniref:Uncharacterized protein n=1 Tax=viral metagenome TaxID=1070528 RepID=A0A6C0CLN4_9ZZZZ
MKKSNDANIPVNKFTVIVLGDSGVGKTSIINWLIHNQFSNYISSTIGVDFNIYEKGVIRKSQEVYDITSPSRLLDDCPPKTKQSDLVHIKCYIYDTAGQEMYKSIIQTYYKKADVCIFVFDLTDKNTLNSVAEWYNDFTQYNTSATKYLVGNKTDLLVENPELTKLSNFIKYEPIDDDYVKMVLNAHDFQNEHVICISASTGFNVKHFFENHLIKDLAKHVYSDPLRGKSKDKYIKLLDDSNGHKHHHHSRNMCCTVL